MAPGTGLALICSVKAIWTVSVAPIVVEHAEVFNVSVVITKAVSCLEIGTEAVKNMVTIGSISFISTMFIVRLIVVWFKKLGVHCEIVHKHRVKLL